MSASNYPDYIGGLIDWPVLRAPYVARQAKTAAFYFHADIQQLQATCDRYLNAVCSPHLHFKAIVPFAMMTFVDIPSGNSLNPANLQYGQMPERDLAFWILTVISKRVACIDVPVGLASFSPYLFVDNPVAQVVGREVYGFRKQLAAFTRDIDIRAPRLSASTYAIQTLGPESQARELPLLDLECISDAQGPAPEWSSAQEATQTVTQPLTDSALIELLDKPFDLALHLLEPKLPVVLLKQLPDSSNANKACYQAIIQSPMQPTRFHGGGFLGGTYQLKLHPLATHPIAQELGLKLDAEGRQNAAFGFWASNDFILCEGTELFVRNRPR